METHKKSDGIANELRMLLHNLLYSPFLQVLSLVFFQMQNNLCSTPHRFSWKGSPEIETNFNHNLIKARKILFCSPGSYLESLWSRSLRLLQLGRVQGQLTALPKINHHKCMLSPSRQTGLTTHKLQSCFGVSVPTAPSLFSGAYLYQSSLWRILLQKTPRRTAPHRYVWW